MDSTYPPQAWKRLGELLERRRGELGYGFRQREQFLRDRGGPPPSLKTVARLERGERAAYPPATVALLESLYDVPPGSFERALSGGSLEPPAPVPDPVRAVPPAAAGDKAAAVLSRVPEPDRPFFSVLLSRLPPEELAAVEGISRMTDGEMRPWPPERVRDVILGYLGVRDRERRQAAGLGTSLRNVKES